MKSTKNNVESFLQQPKGVKKSWTRSLFVFLIAIVGYGILLALTINYGNFMGTQTPNSVPSFINNLNSHANLTNAVGILSILSFCLIALPFVCWFSMWIIGINQVSKSPYFHLFLWLIASLLMVLLLIAIIIFIRASVWDFNTIYQPDTSAPADPNTPPPETYFLR